MINVPLADFPGQGKESRHSGIALPLQSDIRNPGESTRRTKAFPGSLINLLRRFSGMTILSRDCDMLLTCRFALTL